MSDTAQGKVGHTPGPWRALAAGIDATMVSTTLSSGRRVSFRVAACKDGDRETVEANARLIAAAPDLDAAASIAITALAFAEETYQRSGDAVALAQTSAAKRALIAAQGKARGRERPMRDVTPTTLAIAGRR